jgi:hypothetical protein
MGKTVFLIKTKQEDLDGNILAEERIIIAEDSGKAQDYLINNGICKSEHIKSVKAIEQCHCFIEEQITSKPIYLVNDTEDLGNGEKLLKSKIYVPAYGVIEAGSIAGSDKPVFLSEKNGKIVEVTAVTKTKVLEIINL